VPVSLTIYPQGSGRVIRVPGDYPTIQEALCVAAAFPGSTVLVAPGTYNEFVTMREGVSLIGEDRESTIIAAPTASHYAVLGANNARISGFTISGGSYGVNCGVNYPPSSPEISNNIIIGSRCAIAIGQGASPIIRSNIITGAESGIVCYSSSAIVKNNLIYNISAEGIELWDGSSATIINNVIDSVGPFGGWGIYLSSASDTSTIKNNIFVNLDIAINNPFGSTLSLSYNDFWNVGIQYRNGDYEGPANGVGDLSSDPLFVDRGSGDYHLQDNSPCIDAGDPAAEYDDVYFPPSKGTQRNDMGAYGGPWTKMPSEPPCVSVVSPNGGEQLEVGDDYDILWVATDDVAVTAIDIYYSTDGGSTYPHVVATGESNDGVYVWTVPDTSVETCRVKVVAHDNQGNTDEDASDSNFAIVPSTGPVDTTLPSTPVVVDDGDYTSSITQLHASWSASDAESGIAEYQYAIGTSPGGTDVVGWTSAGTNTEAAATGLSLSLGTTYYFAVKAKNGVGLWSDVGVSDGITISPATLKGQVWLQGRPAPPHESWVTSLIVTLYQPGETEPLATYEVQTSDEGKFEITRIAPGTYDIKVKHTRSLANLVEGVVMEASETQVDFGTLREGNCNGDTTIDITDFSLLRASFGRMVGEEGYNDSCDFNRDGIVDITDFSLLRQNFGEME